VSKLQNHKLSNGETLPPAPAVTERAKPNRARISVTIRTRKQNRPLAVLRRNWREP
jgi:hypothetical protein